MNKEHNDTPNTRRGNRRFHKTYLNGIPIARRAREINLRSTRIKIYVVSKFIAIFIGLFYERCRQLRVLYVHGVPKRWNNSLKSDGYCLDSDSCCAIIFRNIFQSPIYLKCLTSVKISTLCAITGGGGVIFHESYKQPFIS